MGGCLVCQTTTFDLCERRLCPKFFLNSMPFAWPWCLAPHWLEIASRGFKVISARRNACSLHIKCPLLASGFNNFNVSTSFIKTPQCQIPRKFTQKFSCCYMRRDGHGNGEPKRRVFVTFRCERAKQSTTKGRIKI